MTYGNRIVSCLLGVLLLFGTVAQYHVPAQAAADAVDPMLSIGNEFIVALASDGTAWSWGQNDVGQLGLGTISEANQTLPARVDAQVRFQSVSAGDSHVLALATDGTVWAWGENGSGQLGDQSTADRSVPVAVHGLSDVDVRQVVAGGNTSFALTEDRRVLAWGANTAGMLGDASLTVWDSRLIPTPIEALEGVFVERLFAGEGIVAAITADGVVWLWGENSKMQCGAPDGQDVSVPTPRIAGAGELSYQAYSVAPGLYHTAILSANDVILNVGQNANGQFGNARVSSGPSYALTANKCTDVTAMQGVVAIAAGSEHMLAMTKDGSLYTWGSNSFGQLAADASEVAYFDAPHAVSLPASAGGTAVAIAAGYHNSAIIDSEGHVFTWGSNSAGQLGNGRDANDPYEPSAVLGSDGEDALYLGLPEEDVTHSVYVTATASIPSPTFSISIPATLDFGTLEQRTGDEEDRLGSVAFEVRASDVKYLFGKSIVVQVSPSSGKSFALIGSKGSTLPYEVYNLSQGGEALAVDAVFATFSSAGSVSGRLVIDKSNIAVADTYSGTLHFRVSTTEASGS